MKGKIISSNNMQQHPSKSDIAEVEDVINSMNKMMKKKIIPDLIASIPIKFQVKDLIEEYNLLPDDIIVVSCDDDGELACYAYRDRLETDEEYTERIQREKFINEDLKKRRYENYLKLKREFENE